MPPDPGNVSAFGLLTVDVKNDYVRTHVTTDPDPDEIEAIFQDLEAQAAEALTGRASPTTSTSAPPTCATTARPTRSGFPADGDVEARFHEAHQKLYGYGYRDDPRHAVEWVNLRVSGIGPITRPALARRHEQIEEPTLLCTRDVHFDTWARTVVYRRRDLGAGAVVVTARR